MPKVSVIIPTYNRPTLLPRAIKSVLNQTYQDFEIIVVDDGLEYRAEEVVKAFNNSRIKYFLHKQSRGGGAARNTGIKNSQGEFIAFLDDDDEWLPEKLEPQVKALEENGGKAGVAICGVAIYDNSEKLLKEKNPLHGGLIQPLNQLLRKCFIWTSALIVRKNLLLEVGMFDENFKKNQEWDLELRLAKVTTFFSIKEALVKINSHENGQMGSISNIDNIISGFEALVNKHYLNYKEQKQSLALRYFQLADLYYYKGNYQKVRLLLFESWINAPLNIVYLAHLLVSLLSPGFYAYLKNKSDVRFFQ